jgi:hypothetical protein
MHPEQNFRRNYPEESYAQPECVEIAWLAGD